MGLPVRAQFKYWGVAAVVLFGALWFLSDILMPFLLGGAIAYFLDPVADRLQRLGLSRLLATVSITIGVVVAFIVLAFLVIPTLIQQAVTLFDIAPRLVRDFQEFLTTQFPSLMDADSTLRKSLLALGDQVQNKGGQLLRSLLSSAASLINIALLLVVVPVVTFYLLYDWDRLVATLDDMLPRDHLPVVRALALEIDLTLASFVRGMGTVCFILGTYYALALMLVGLQFGLVVGFIAGLVTFIPYVGALVGGALAIGLGLFQFWGDWLSLGLVGAIFIAGQMIEGNYLTPKLVGLSVGLHPVWLLFALSVFGSLFGFAGMLVAVPVAAAIGVLARFGIGQYKL
ncbi:MAG: AI-2E family transporter, partial [Rhodobacterales bacterium]